MLINVTFNRMSKVMFFCPPYNTKSNNSQFGGITQFPVEKDVKYKKKQYDVPLTYSCKRVDVTCHFISSVSTCIQETKL